MGCSSWEALIAHPFPPLTHSCFRPLTPWLPFRCIPCNLVPPTSTGQSPGFIPGLTAATTTEQSSSDHRLQPPQLRDAGVAGLCWLDLLGHAMPMSTRAASSGTRLGWGGGWAVRRLPHAWEASTLLTTSSQASWGPAMGQLVTQRELAKERTWQELPLLPSIRGHSCHTKHILPHGSWSLSPLIEGEKWAPCFP